MHRLHQPELRFGHTRETLLFAEWASASGRDFLGSLGLTGGWWCALNLPRSEVFEESSSGDIDVLAGPLALTINAHELYLMARDVRREKPHYTAGMLVNAALIRAGREGAIQWPPEIGYTIGIEVKTSHYDGRTWKAQHTGERAKILGALDERSALGINDLTFMHLGIVKPTTSAPEMDAMFADAGSSFPAVFEPADLGEHGYYRHLLAGVEQGDRTVWGGLGGGWLHLSTPRPYRPQPWHESLKARLGLLPPPTFFRTFIVRCDACGKWRHSADADASGMVCECGRGFARTG
jgi:hypothetical protein